jgi:hypothetical protein
VLAAQLLGLTLEVLMLGDDGQPSFLVCHDDA